MKKSKNKRKNHNTTNNNLKVIADKRTGGAINLRGIGFQLLYACYRSLLELSETSKTKIQLEGIEDVDILGVFENEFIQLKTSINSIGASGLWNQRVLQNFMEVFKSNPDSKFSLVYNAQISKGKLDDLINRKQEAVDFWKQKFLDDQIEIEGIDFNRFLSSISYTSHSEDELNQMITDQLIEKFQLNKDVLDQHLYTLFYNVHLWSRDRKTIDFNDIVKIFQDLKDSFSKQIVNPAIQHNWIRKILFEQSEISEEDNYFEGKAARPHHIVQGLPVRRLIWEQRIEESVKSFNVTVIKSSSGQGKSTLAWCAAQNLKIQGYSIYELQDCKDQSQVAGLFDFLCTRLKIGETPILVIDGLNSDLANWSKLIDQLQGIPIKVIVTTREEDWYRYGCDASKVRLQVINIHLSIIEAEEIFNQLKSNNKLSDPSIRWQSAWESIEDKKLLIEYVFLLTRGEMIAERINHQIKELNRSSSGSAAKLEILRLISLADTLNIRISIQSLTDLIQSTIRFTEDRGEVYKQLESEYYLKFGEYFVEGLHPVRSQHLVNALHETIPLKESLVSLFKIIEQTNVFDFFANLAVDNKIKQIQGLYADLAPVLEEKNFSWKVSALDGLLFYDIHNYWKINQQSFDEIFATGALDLFVMDMVPFKKIGIIENLGNSLPGSLGDGFRNLSLKKEIFSTFDIKASETWNFANSIESQLPNDYNVIDDYDSLNFLIGWFVKLDIQIKNRLQFDIGIFRELMNNHQVKELNELSRYFLILQDQDYISFCKNNKIDIFSFLKSITDSISLEEVDHEIVVKYLLQNDELAKSHEPSVYRIETIHGFLPFYDKYRCQAIVLPFPNAEIYQFVLENANKAMSPENINNPFDVHLNVIWRKTILDKYRASSSYEWQEQILKQRYHALGFVKTCVRYFGAIIENNSSRIKSTELPLYESSIKFIEQYKVLKTYPEYKKTSITETLSSELKKINDWSSKIRDFVNQYFWLIKPENNNSRNLAYRNFESAVYALSQMQESFDNILESTTRYVETNEIDKEESEWYRRLFNILQYFIEVFVPSGQTKTIKNSKDSIANWIEERNFTRVTQLRSIVYEIESKFLIYSPKYLVEKEKSLHAIIGVDCLNVENGDDISELSFHLRELAETEIDWFTFVNAKNGRAISAFRCHRYFFERVKKCVENDEEFDQGGFGNPLAMDLKEISLDPLEGIYFEPFENQQEVNAYLAMMQDVWRLLQYRTHLNNECTFEGKLLAEKQKVLGYNIKEYLRELSMLFDKEKYNSTNYQTTEFLEGRLELSETEIITQLSTWNKEINDDLFSEEE
ncbi:MAG: hypothetical protein ACO1N0_00665 [Fluviicola sp.]